MNVAEDWTGGLQEPNGLKCPCRCMSGTGYHRCHGEDRMSDCSFKLKSVLEASVWNVDPQCGDAARAWLVLRHPTGYIRLGCAASGSRGGMQSVQPGVELATYSTTGFFFEHGNPDLSAGMTIPGKLPSPAMSQAGGIVPVVVRARESRVHGKGGQ